jgi:NAD(P)-dependent dehydrogenase (short-subunit alcohol dehydrogenase family)
MSSNAGHRAVVLVTGGSRGIGAATARAFAEDGALVVVTHRDSRDGAEETVASLAGTGHRVIQVSATDSVALGAAAASIDEVEGRLDVLVNNAATTRVIAHDDLDALDDDFFDTIMRTNVRGPFATIRAFRALLDADGGGVVVNVSSLASRMANGSNVAYCASKAALDNMTLSLARALAPDIRVLSVAPGLVETELTKGWAPDRRESQLRHTPLARLGTPEDIAHSIVAAATRLTFSTGIVIPVDGGRPLS